MTSLELADLFAEVISNNLQINSHSEVLGVGCHPVLGGHSSTLLPADTSPPPHGITDWLSVTVN